MRAVELEPGDYYEDENGVRQITVELREHAKEDGYHVVYWVRFRDGGMALRQFDPYLDVPYIRPGKP